MSFLETGFHYVALAGLKLNRNVPASVSASSGGIVCGRLQKNYFKKLFKRLLLTAHKYPGVFLEIQIDPGFSTLAKLIIQVHVFGSCVRACMHACKVNLLELVLSTMLISEIKPISTALLTQGLLLVEPSC